MLTNCPEEPEAAPLYYAARLGFRELTKDLIAENPEYINATGWYKRTAMHAAASEGHTQILSLLIDHGVDVECRDIWGNTALHLVTSQSAKLEAGQFLVDRGADIDATNQYNETPLMYATRRGYIEYARMPFERGAAIDVPGYLGIHSSSLGGQREKATSRAIITE